MLEIYVCEDNEKQLSLFTKYINNTLLIENLDMKISKATTDPYELLGLLQSSENIGLFFLDIDLKSDINGLTLAQRIRKMQPRCYIIFITSHSEMSFLTFQYKVEALDFIIKDTSEHIKTKIHECLLNVADNYTTINNNIHKVYTITQNDRSVSIEYENIISFETSANVHKIILHAKNRTIEFTGQLKDLEKQLDHRFYRCHRSFIINSDNISQVDYNELTISMNNGETYPVSVRMKKGLKKLFS